jgi:hypothetical protein
MRDTEKKGLLPHVATLPQPDVLDTLDAQRFADATDDDLKAKQWVVKDFRAV